MNTGFYKDLDTNFDKAYEMSAKEYSHTELLDMLKNGNIPEKQIAAMKIETVNNVMEAEILINNLTGCDGKIREAVAFRINRFLKSAAEYITLFKDFPEIFADSAVDINGNICRLTAENALIMKQDGEFAEKFIQKILKYIQESFAGLDGIKFRDKKYTVNKQLFKLYWCLENIKNYSDKISQTELYRILERSSIEREYTIREKAAQILVNLSQETFTPLKTKLLDDENYYVRSVFCNKS